MKDFLSGKNKAGVIYSLFICFNICFTFLGQSVALACFGEQTFGFRIFSSACSMIAVVFCSLMYSVCNGKRLLKVVPLKCKSRWLLYSLGICVGMMFGMGLVNYKVSEIVTKLGLNASGTDLTIDGSGEFIGYLLTIGILTPLFEETFFRGILIDATEDFSVVFAVVFSSVCFALYHGNITQLVYQLVYGALLSMLAICSESILPSVFAHILNNATLLVFMFLGFDITYICEKWYAVVSGLIILAVVIVGLTVNIKKGEKRVSKYGYSGTVLISLFGLGIMFLMLVLNMVG